MLVTSQLFIIIITIESCRLYRKRCQGRLRKHLADLCLLAGQAAEALLHYQTALDILRSASDWLWLAGKVSHLDGLSGEGVI